MDPSDPLALFSLALHGSSSTSGDLKEERKVLLVDDADDSHLIRTRCLPSNQECVYPAELLPTPAEDDQLSRGGLERRSGGALVDRAT